MHPTVGFLMTVLSQTILVLVSSCLFMELFARAFQLRDKIRSCRQDLPQKQVPKSPARNSFVSVHVAISSEPPEVVIETLHRLAESNFSDFEVIVVDNNTSDPALWMPIQVETDRLGSRFRFIHIERLEGAKAGALNIALDRCDRRTTQVAVVDADYQVGPEFLRDGVDALNGSGADYVQFPQAYRGVGKSARGVEHELGDYFTCFASGAGRIGSMLPTGTLSIFSETALRAVGGWPTNTITEDAEIGVRLQAAGFRGLWLSSKQGEGLLPLDFAGLSKQRARWAAGNLQVLKGVYSQRWTKLNPSEAASLVVQLTAWLTLWLPAMGALVLVGTYPAMPLARPIAMVSAITILASAALTASRMLIAPSGGVALKVGLEAFVTKIALTWISASAWIPALTARPLRFQRTLKSIGGGRFERSYGLAVASSIFLVLTVLYVLRGAILEAVACSLLASVWLCARWIDAGLIRASKMNLKVR